MTARWCTWHSDYAEGVELVRIIETGTGPGGMLYACPPCRTEHGLTPLVEQSATEEER